MGIISLATSEWMWYSGGESGVSAVVGNDWANNAVLRRVGRVQFTAPETGAAGVEITFHTNKVANSGKFTPLNFYIGTDPDSHANAGPDSDATGSLILGSDYLTYTGSADIMLLPNQAYYLWIFPANSEYGWCYGTRQNHTSTLTTVGIAHTVPVVRITDLFRCDIDGNEDRQGTHAMVVFDATVDNEDEDNTASYILLYRVRGESTWEEIPMDAYAGVFELNSATYIFPVDVDKTYEVAVAAVDSVIRVESQYRVIPKAFFFFYGDWDLEAWGFGCAASIPNSITMGMKMLISKGIYLQPASASSLDATDGMLTNMVSMLDNCSIQFACFRVGSSYWFCILFKVSDQSASAEFFSPSGRCRKVMESGTWGDLISL